MTYDQQRLISRRTLVMASAALLLPLSSRISIADDNIVANPGDDLAAAVAKLSARGGGRLRLRPGNYGTLRLAGIAAQVDIEGEPGAVLGRTDMWKCSGLHFRQVSFRGERSSDDNMPALVQTNPDCRSISFSDCTFATTEDVSSWRPVDWVERPYATGLLVRGRDVRLTKCRFFNLRNCLGLMGDGSLAESCTFESFGNDGIDFGASDLRIANNVIRGGFHTALDPLHADGMQGFPAPKNGVYSNIVIDNNHVEFAGPGDYMQGISIFDGRWRNVQVSNNTVRVNLWNAIALYGIDGVVVERNTVSSSDPKVRNWIEVRASKGGVPSTGVIVRDNVAPLVKAAPGAAVSNNKIRID